MNLPTALLTIRWMIWDTFRQSVASRLFAIMLGVTALCILLALSIRVEGDDRLPIAVNEDPLRLPAEELQRIGRDIAPTGKAFAALAGNAGFAPHAEALGSRYARSEGYDAPSGKVSIGFGLFVTKLGRDRLDAVRYLEIVLAGGIADTAGIFLALIWTAGFLPTFLEPSQATVLLAKPVPRWSLVIGKYFGVVIFVAIQAALFVGGTWLALGLRTGIFDPLYLLTIPLLVLHFGIFYSFSVLMAVWSRSTVVCLFATLVFWLACWGMNFARHTTIAYEDPIYKSAPKSLEIGYWLLPKPGDLSLILYDALKADGFSVKVAEFQKVEEVGAFHPTLSLLSSLLFAVVILGISARELHTIDY